tara:strand:- start:3123 stop:4286 length:1164 start_codon:yes stop_codon:yes gene_type:complete
MTDKPYYFKEYNKPVSFIKQKLKKLLLPLMIYYRDDNHYYYGRYKGSFSFLRILVWTIFHPGRLYNLFRFGQLFKFNSVRKKRLEEKLKITSSSDDDKVFDNSKLINKFDEFSKNGAVILENFFPEKRINKFLEKYDPSINDFLKTYNASDIKKIQTNNNIAQTVYMPFSNELVDLWLNKKLMNFITSAYGQRIGSKIYARNYPNLLFNVVVNDKSGSRFRHEERIAKRAKTQEGADCWHPDHSVLLNVHVLLDDLTEEDPHMEFIPIKRNFYTMGFAYSDEVVNNFAKKPVKCIGKKGTVYIHAGSTIHRLKVQKGSRRVLHFEFTAGSNILYDSRIVAKCLNNDFDIEKLDEAKRNIIRGIFPKIYFKGYEINKEILSPTKFKGI